MDTTLHCNDLKCRAVVNDRAVVTTCSHVFCLSCADRLELTAPKDGQRKCPACNTFLLNLDDAVVASLNPSEDYKTSILSGLSPTIIMECAGRGLSFWAYQMVQEITYQEYLSRSLAERYTNLSAHMDGMAREINGENQKLHAKLEAVHAENVELSQKYQNLDKQFREKNQSMEKYRELYTKIKSQIANPGMESAADYEIDQALHAGNTQRESQHQHARDNGVHRDRRSNSGDSFERRQPSGMQNTGYVSSQRQAGLPLPSRGGTADTAPPVSSQSRQPLQQLPEPTFGKYNHTFHRDTALPRGATPRGHAPMGSYQAGSPSGGGPGLSANVRTSRPMAGPFQHVPGSRGTGSLIGAGRPVYRPELYR